MLLGNRSLFFRDSALFERRNIRKGRKCVGGGPIHLVRRAKVGIHPDAAVIAPEPRRHVDLYKQPLRPKSVCAHKKRAKRTKSAETRLTKSAVAGRADRAL